jgi:putative acetyltransferase
VDEIVVDAEQDADHAAVDEVARRAFAGRPEVSDMVSAIRASPRFQQGIAFVARVENRVVGFVMLSGTDLVDDVQGRREVLTLTPLAVVPECERRGIGSALVRAALDEAERRGEPLVFVQGSSRYYGRLGFRSAIEHGISIDLPEWRRAGAQVYLLSSYDSSITGRIEYPPEIAAVSD